MMTSLWCKINLYITETKRETSCSRSKPLCCTTSFENSSKRTMQDEMDSETKVSIARNAQLITFLELRDLLNRVSLPKAQFFTWFESVESGKLLHRPQFDFENTMDFPK
ncbi:hypothetical protein NPIL_576491 [Nephila pilipes]|uniref:Uncharacterized protein n=1 Tax=Nephila pilipes TaxID=299642 RepID=A0A8X6IPY9_NEPPI|nr:hypothetical protein NPIL_576491 [Nephila pilipes]